MSDVFQSTTTKMEHTNSNMNWKSDVRELEEDEHLQELLLEMNCQKGVVDKTILTKWLTKYQARRDSFQRLPITLLCLLVWILTMDANAPTDEISLTQRYVRNMLTGSTFEGIEFTSGHKTLEDVDTIEDVYTFLKEVMLPMFINPLSTDDRDRHRVLRHNQIIGGLSLKQLRRQKMACSKAYRRGGILSPGSINRLFDRFTCYPSHTASRDCFGPDNATLREQLGQGWCPASKDASWIRRLTRRLDYVPESSGTGASEKGATSERDRDYMYVVNFLEVEGLDHGLAKTAQMETYKWIDEATSWLGMQFLLLNPATALFTAYRVNIYFPPSGAIYPNIRAESFQLQKHQDMSAVVFGVFFVIMLAALFLDLVLFLSRSWRTEGIRAFMTAWNLLSAAVIFVGVVALAWYFIGQHMLDTVRVLAMEVRQKEPLVGQSITADYSDRVIDLHEEVSFIANMLYYWRSFLCYYSMLMCTKLLESFTAQPKLAIVTNTLGQSFGDLFHFLIVATVGLLSYCVAGMFLFGRRLREFSTPAQTLHTCLRMMLGDFDWDALVDEDPVTANLWFITFISLHTLVLLNMLMAIVMDEYTLVKGDAEAEESLPRQIVEMAKEAIQKYRGKRVSTGALLQAAESIDAEQIDIKALMAAAGPVLTEEQADMLFSEAKRAHSDELNKGTTISEAMSVTGYIKIAVDQISDRLEEVQSDQADISKMLLHGHPGISAEETNGDPNGACSDPASPDELASADPDFNPLFEDADEQMRKLEVRMSTLESFLNDSMKYMSFRGKDLCNHLDVIEGLISHEKDKVKFKLEREVWDEAAPHL